MRFAKIALAAASMTFAFSSTAARAAICQPGTSGCVLPLPGPVASVPVQTSPGPAPVLVEEEAGFNFLPYLIGLAALAAAGYFLFLDDDRESP